MALLLTSLAPARTVALRSSMEPAAVCAAAANFSKVLRACSTLASAIDRISLGISNRSRTSSLMVRSFVLAGIASGYGQGAASWTDAAPGRFPFEPLTAVHHHPTQPAAKGSRRRPD